MEESMTRLIDIAEQMGQDGWPLLVESMLNHARVMLVSNIIVLFIVLMFALGITYVLPLKEAWEDEDAVIYGPWAGCMCIFLLGMFVCVVNLCRIIPAILCPECEAVRELLP
jgi:hypothetical protein